MSGAIVGTNDQGLDPHKYYPGVVVTNKHPDEKLKYVPLIQVRVAGIMDEKSDEELPWAAPLWGHVDGASADSGILAIPKVGSKIALKFQGGSPLHPLYRGYPVDLDTILDEGKENYPDRAVLRFQNGMCVVVDTKDNEILVQSPGNLKCVVGGDLELTVLGNYTTKISGNRTDTTNGDIVEKGNSKKTIIKTDLSEKIGGDKSVHVQGSSSHNVTGDYSKSAANVSIQAKMAFTMFGTTISEQASAGLTYTAGASIMSSAGASITGLAGATNLQFGSSYAAMISAGGGSIGVGAAVSMVSSGAINMSSGGQGINFESPSTPAAPTVPSAPPKLELPKIPELPKTPTFQPSHFKGINRGTLPDGDSGWSDKI